MYRCVQMAQKEEAYEETIGDLTDRLKDVSVAFLSSFPVELSHKTTNVSLVIHR